MLTFVQFLEKLLNGERTRQNRKKKLEQTVEKFQSEADDAKAHRQWKQIEKTIFGVRFRD